MGNKAILMSIKPQYVCEILNGKKTIEIRKKFPKDYVGWVYIYCTKGKENLYKDYYVMSGKEGYFLTKCGDVEKLNGKVVARFWCDKVEDIYFQIHFNGSALETDYLTMSQLLEKSCLTKEELNEYLGKIYKFGETYGYAIHITKLEVFDKPKELEEFKHWVAVWQYCGMDCPPYVDDELRSLYKAPQSWCYIWE